MDGMVNKAIGLHESSGLHAFQQVVRMLISCFIVVHGLRGSPGSSTASKP